MGGPGGLNEGGDFISLTPKCDMFLKIPRADQTKNVGKVGKLETDFVFRKCPAF